MTPLRILVVIPTTGGPILVKSLRPRAGLPASTAFADGDYRPLPWSADYARLAATDGPMARLLPRANLAPHELRLTGSFDAGRSWEAPVSLAHALIAAGHRLVGDPAEAELIVWATGAVDLDLRLIPGGYALLDKIDRSRALLDSAPGAALAVLLPPDIERDEAERACLSLGRRTGAMVLAAETIPDAAAALGPRGSAPASRPSPGRAARSALFAGLFVIAAALIGAAQWRASLDAPASTSDAPAPGAPRPDERPPGDGGPKRADAPPEAPILVEELHAPAGSSCRRVVFGADPPERRPVAIETDGRLRASRLTPDLCGLAFRSRSAGARLAVGAELRAAALPPVGLADGAQAYFLRENARRNLVYAVQVEVGGAGPERLAHALAR